METATVREGEPSGSDGGESRLQTDELDLTCIRCGVCCTVYQVRIGRAEAGQIAESMGMDYWDWVGQYCDPRWSDPRSHLIRHDDRGCVFLSHSPEQGALCGIYRVRPSSCRDWAADALKPACQEGLRRFWNVTVDPAGRLQGSEDDLSRLQAFLQQS